MSSPPPSIDAPSLPLDHPLSQASPTAVSVISPNPDDPPPPYPSPRVRRARGTRSNRRVSGNIQGQQHFQLASNESDNEIQAQARRSPTSISLVDATEATPLLGGTSSTSTSSSTLTPGPSTFRPRSISQSSMTSFAPSLAVSAASLAQTAWVFFSECDDDDEGADHIHNEELDDAHRIEGEGEDRPLLRGVQRERGPARLAGASITVIDEGSGFFSRASWARYFRPLSRPIYWRSLVHLVLVNFPFALAAWVYLFVFTLTGTTLLILLPLGALLCFFNLLGARAFSRAELYIQTSFHNPLHYPLSVLQATITARAPSIDLLIAKYPIFTRSRPASASELESGQAVVGEDVVETSFYKNANLMFTDPTTYQALFYFLIIKPAITLLFTVVFLAIGLPLIILIIPAPIVLRVCRKVGKWQAVVAVEGLIVGVR